jgi:hypothetical protein
MTDRLSVNSGQVDIVGKRKYLPVVLAPMRGFIFPTDIF